jgi:hypothetical protein
MEMRTIYNVVADVPALGLRTGDVVVVDPGQAAPVLLVRSLPPNYGSLLASDMDGALVPSDISPHAPAVRALQSPAAQRPLRGRPR